MRAGLAALAVVAALAACGGGDDDDPTVDEVTTSTVDDDAAREADWLADIKAANSQDGNVEIVTVNISPSRIMRITTNLGAATNDPVRRGMAAQVCFDVRATGWIHDIEVHAATGHVLAWTGADNSGCVGYDR